MCNGEPRNQCRSVSILLSCVKVVSEEFRGVFRVRIVSVIAASEAGAPQECPVPLAACPWTRISWAGGYRTTPTPPGVSWCTRPANRVPGCRGGPREKNYFFWASPGETGAPPFLGGGLFAYACLGKIPRPGRAALNGASRCPSLTPRTPPTAQDQLASLGVPVPAWAKLAGRRVSLAFLSRPWLNSPSCNAGDRKWHPQPSTSQGRLPGALHLIRTPHPVFGVGRLRWDSPSWKKPQARDTESQWIKLGPRLMERGDSACMPPVA
jgi:hypothetical protein